LQLACEHDQRVQALDVGVEHKPKSVREAALELHERDSAING
jgi:hypothetical protein